jgi:hypothetical protein
MKEAAPSYRNDGDRSCGMKKRKGLSLRETADTTKARICATRPTLQQQQQKSKVNFGNIRLFFSFAAFNLKEKDRRVTRPARTILGFQLALEVVTWMLP